MLNFIPNLITLISNHLNGEEGQGMVEYVLIIALIAVAVIGALTLLGPQISQIFTNIGNSLP